MSRKKITNEQEQPYSAGGFDAYYARCVTALAYNENLSLELKAGEHTKALCRSVANMGRSWLETVAWLGRADVAENIDAVVLRFPSHFYASEARQRFGKELRSIWPNKRITTEPRRSVVPSVCDF